jgi:hypothetical protein
MSAIPATDFPRFSELPAELREEIWLYCLPARVFELSSPNDGVIFWEPGKSITKDQFPCELRHTSRMNRVPPLIAKVCHESRILAFKTGAFTSTVDDLPTDTERPPESQWPMADANKHWLSRSRDTVHMSWTPADTGICGYDRALDAQTLPFLAWNASFFHSAPSIMLEHLGSHYFSPLRLMGVQDNNVWPYGIPLIVPTSLPWTSKKQSDFDALKKISHCQVVVRIVVVHTDAQTAGKLGLFGLLSDARVQIVDVADEAKVAAFMSFAEACERKSPAIVPQDFTVESAEEMRLALRGVILTEFASEELAATMRPAIMFRLCTRACNHVGYDPKYNTGTCLGLLGHYPGGYGYDRGMLGYRRGEGRWAQSRRFGGSRWDCEWRPCRDE